MSKKTHVLLTVIPGNEICVDVFTTKQAAFDYVKSNIRQQWDEIHWEDVGDEGINELDKIQDEAKKSLDENGYWKDGWGNTYIYNEKDFTK